MSTVSCVEQFYIYFRSWHKYVVGHQLQSNHRIMNWICSRINSVVGTFECDRWNFAPVMIDEGNVIFLKCCTESPLSRCGPFWVGSCHGKNPFALKGHSSSNEWCFLGDFFCMWPGGCMGLRIPMMESHLYLKLSLGLVATGITICWNFWKLGNLIDMDLQCTSHYQVISAGDTFIKKKKKETERKLASYWDVHPKGFRPLFVHERKCHIPFHWPKHLKSIECVFVPVVKKIHRNATK